MATKQKKQKQEFVTFTTPICPTRYNHLNKPDEYKGKKTFKTELVMTPEELDEIKETIDAEVDAVYAKSKKEIEGTLKGIKLKKALAALEKAYPYEEQEDDDGELTGDFLVRFKSVPKPNGKRRFPIVDADGELTNTLVFGGSKIRIEAYVKPYYMKSTGMAGVTLYINGVQIAELAGDDGDGGFVKTSFDKIEGGYVASDDDDDGYGESYEDDDDGDDAEDHDDF